MASMRKQLYNLQREQPDIFVQKEIASLRGLAINACARGLEHGRFPRDLRHLPVADFVEIIHLAKNVAPAIMTKLQSENPCIASPELDEAYWRREVEGHILRRTAPMPLPKLCAVIKRHCEALLPLMPDTAPTASELEAAKEALKALGTLPMPVAALQATQAGRIVKRLKKATDAGVAGAAGRLIDKWRIAVRVLEVKVAAVDSAAAGGGGASAGSGGGSSVSSGGGSGGSGPSEDVAAAGAAMRQQQVETASRCATWFELYTFLEELRRAKMDSFSARAKRMREETATGRKHTIQLTEPKRACGTIPSAKLPPLSSQAAKPGMTPKMGALKREFQQSRPPSAELNKKQSAPSFFKKIM